MSFALECPACHKAVTASPELYGRVIGCPHCARHFLIPAAGAPAVCVATPTSNLDEALGAIRFTFDCKRCGSILEARGSLCGQSGRCPTCGAVFVIPQVDPRTGLPLGPAVVTEDGQLPTPLHAYANAGDKAPKIRRKDDGESIIECPRCRREMPIDANLCDACGMPFTMEGAAAIVHFNAGQSNGWATAALTIGVISLVAACAPGLGAIAIVLGLFALARTEKLGTLATGRGAAIGGIVTGALGLGWLALFLL